MALTTLDNTTWKFNLTKFSGIQDFACGCKIKTYINNTLYKENLTYDSDNFCPCVTYNAEASGGPVVMVCISGGGGSAENDEAILILHNQTVVDQKIDMGWLPVGSTPGIYELIGLESFEKISELSEFTFTILKTDNAEVDSSEWGVESTTNISVMETCFDQVSTAVSKNILMHPIGNDGTLDTDTNLYPKTTSSNLVDIIETDLKTINNQSIIGTGNITIEDTKVTNTVNSGVQYYVTGTTSAATSTDTQVFDTGVYVTATPGQLRAGSIAIGDFVIKSLGDGLLGIE